MILIIGAFLGLFSVAFGAYAEHGIKPHITEDQVRSLMTALRYNQINSVVITAIGLALCSSDKLKSMAALKWSGIIFIAGAFIFSFTIYLSIVLNIPKLTFATPVGGVTLMAGWLSLIVVGIKARKS
jgi:uncharacterized membrane protein YgdD (TMEM256/DUF423 family)